MEHKKPVGDVGDLRLQPEVPLSWDEEQNAIQDEIDEDIRKQTKFTIIWGWVWFCITTPIWIGVVLWVISRVDRTTGIVILFLFLMTRELRLKAIGQLNVQSIVAQQLSAQLKAIQNKLGISEPLKLDREDRRVVNSLNKNALNSIIQGWVEYALVLLFIVFALLGEGY